MLSPDYVVVAVVVWRSAAGQVAMVVEVVAMDCKLENIDSVVVEVVLDSVNYSIASSFDFDASTYSYWHDFCDRHVDQPIASAFDTNNMSRRNAKMALMIDCRSERKIVYFCWTCHHYDSASFSVQFLFDLKFINIFTA